MTEPNNNIRVETDTQREFKNRKVCDLDVLNTELLKRYGLPFWVKILHLINECWKCDILITGQTAEVITLFKSGERNNFENYCEIMPTEVCL